MALPESLDSRCRALLAEEDGSYLVPDAAKNHGAALGRSQALEKLHSRAYLQAIARKPQTQREPPLNLGGPIRANRFADSRGSRGESSQVPELNPFSTNRVLGR